MNRDAPPLADVGVIVTRPARQAARLAQRLAALGARPIVWPAIVVLPPADPVPLARAHAQLGAYDMAVFVSPNAVEFGAPDPAAWPRSLAIYTPGMGSAEAVEAVGLPAPRVPRHSFDSAGLLALPELADVAGKRVLIFRGEDGRAELGDALRARGAQVDYVACYRREAPRGRAEGLIALLSRGDAQALSLTSIEGLHNLLAAVGRDGRAALAILRTFAPHPRIVAAARAEGLDARETPPGDGGLIAALLESFGPPAAGGAVTPAAAPSTAPHARHPMNDVDILVTAPLPSFLYDPLKADYRTHDYAQATDKPALLRELGPRIRGLVQGGGTVTPTTLLDALPALEIISVFGVGYDGVPVDYCKRRGLKVTHTPDVLTDDVADVAVALVLMTSRGFASADRYVRSGDWVRRGFPLTTRLAGRTAGILGLGRIGKAIAQRLEQMRMRIAYTGRKPQDVPYRYVPDLATLAAESDFLIVACPGGSATRNLVDARILAALGPKGIVVNIARGSIIDEPALVAALQDGTIKGAGLDVFADEPNVPPALFAMDNVVLLPHVGSATRETRQAMGDLCKANLDAWFGEHRTLTLVPELV